MAIVGEDLDKYVWEQIIARQEFLGNANKTDNNLVFFNAKTSWVKLASGVFLEDSKAIELASTTGGVQFIKGMGLAKNHILSSGLSSFNSSTKSLQQRGGLNTSNISNNSYDITPEFGIVPMPGLKDVSIKSLNRGSLKKARVKLRVENYQQLQIIDTLYLRLGYTLLLEWGNSIYLSKDQKLIKPTPTFLEETFFNLGRNQSYLNLLPQIEKLRDSSNGNYDGFIGKVSNFDWNFNEDGSYDINLELISLGDVIESLKSNVVLDKSTTSFIKALTGGGTSIILSDLDNTVNAYRDSNSLFSLLYLYKYQNRSTGLTGYGYDTSNGLCISSIKNGTSFENYFIGDVCTPGSSSPISTTLYDITLELTLGYADIQTNPNNTTPAYSDYIKYYDIGYIKYPNPIKITMTVKNATTSLLDPNTGLNELVANIKLSPTQPADFSFVVHGVPSWSTVGTDLKYEDIRDVILPILDSTPLVVNGISMNSRDDFFNKPQGSGRNEFQNLYKKLAEYGFVPVLLSTPEPQSKQLVNTPSSFATSKSYYGSEPYTYKLVSEFYTDKNDSQGTNNRLNIKDLYPSKGRLSFAQKQLQGLGTQSPPLIPPQVVGKYLYNPIVSLAGTTVPNPLIDAQKKIYGGPSTKVDVVRLYTNSGGVSSMKYYIRFKHLLDLLKTDVLSRVDAKSITYEDNPSIIDINTQDDPTKTTGKNRFKSFMQYKPNISSYLPSDCIVQNTLYPDLTDTTTYLNQFAKDNGSKNNSKSLEKFVFKNPQGQYCNSMNIYLSFDFVGDLLQSNLDDKLNLSIYSFIKGICSGINKSFGGINNLEPVVDETTNILSIVDSSKNNSKDFDKYKINPFGLANSKTQGSFVRDIGLKTAITPQYATMITVGATAGGYVKGTEATAFANWNKGIVDRFNTGLIPANKNSTSGGSQLQDSIDLFTTIFTGDLSYFGVSGLNKQQITSNDYFTELTFDDGLASKNLNIATEYFKAYPAYQLQQKNKDGGNIGFIPFNVSLKMDGISGIKIYNKIELDTRFLPPNYSDSLNFIVTGVDHKLSNNDWETSLNLTLIPNPITKYSKTKSSGIAFNVPSGGAPGVYTAINNASAMTDSNLWIYLAWQQGPGGAAQHYDIANGTRTSYGINVSNITGNWPPGKIASNGVNASNIATYYSTDPKSLAQAFIEVWKSFYDGKIATKVTNFQSGINTGKTERNGITYLEISSVFNEVASTGQITYNNLVNFAAIENNYNVDSATVTGNTTYRGMFQINKNSSDFSPILTATNDGPGYTSGFTKYWKNGDYIRKVYPFIGQFFNSFKSNSSSWSTNNP